MITEVNQIQSTVPTAAILLNDTFTVKTLSDSLAFESAPIVHLATHGQFSSANEETFVLTWNDRLNINTLNNLLQTSELNENGPLELLVSSWADSTVGWVSDSVTHAGVGFRSSTATYGVLSLIATSYLLSACETATGDQQAALGMAGMAVRSGARSTIATLWQVNDEATSLLMSELYQQLGDRPINKAAALRKAQLAVLKNPQYRRHPYYWASFILVGNWL